MLSRRVPLVLMLVPLLLALPAAPAHDKGDQGQWDLPCFDPAPTSPELGTLYTEALGFTPGELAFTDDLLIVSRWGSGGFALYSLDDPAAPSYLSTVGTPRTALDVKPSADGQNVFIGSTGRIYIADISDPAHPVLRKAVSLPIGQDQGHMLHDTVINGKEYLVVATQSGSGVYIYEVVGDDPASRNLALTARFLPGSPLAAHDVYVQHDPVLDRPILYVANGFGGWAAADLSDPSLPIPLAVVPNPDAGQSYVHTVQAQWIEGRRIVATISELGGNILRVWDATVLTAPLLLAEWSIQSDLGFVPSVSSQHNIQIVDGLLYMAHYRCGFYVFDLTTLTEGLVPEAIAPIAHYAPQVTNGQHWDIILKDGLIYTSDMRMQNGGAFYVVSYTALTQGDVAHTSTG